MTQPPIFPAPRAPETSPSAARAAIGAHAPIDPLAVSSVAARVLSGSGRRTFRRVRPGSGRCCEVAVTLGVTRFPSDSPLDLSMGGCSVRYLGAPLPRGTAARVELGLPGVNVLLDAVVAWCSEDRVGLAFLPGAPMEAAWVPLQAYILGLTADSQALDD